MTTVNGIELLKKHFRPHWYKTHIEACPVCGNQDAWKERVYGKKPNDPAQWYSYEQHYDWCEERGL